jgi:hypothetical protein
MENLNREMHGVVHVAVEWHGDDLQGRVGEHLVKCQVTRLATEVPQEEDGVNVSVYKDEAGRDVVTQCFGIPFSILDTNECTLPVNHPMRHQCHSSTICVNTIGGYECLCPRDDSTLNPAPGSTAKDKSFWEDIAKQQPIRNDWELSYNRTSRTTCTSQYSTYGCCIERPYSKNGIECRRGFRCPVDPCGGSSGSGGNRAGAVVSHDCAASAECVRTESPLQHPNFNCQCPDGFMGNGHKCRATDPKPEPKVMHDLVTPTEETVKQNYYCDCTKPVVDACAGFPTCTGTSDSCSCVLEYISNNCCVSPKECFVSRLSCGRETPNLRCGTGQQGLL